MNAVTIHQPLNGVRSAPVKDKIEQVVLNITELSKHKIRCLALLLMHSNKFQVLEQDKDEESLLIPLCRVSVLKSVPIGSAINL